MIPGFEPTPESYAVAVEALGRAGAVMHAAGVTDPGDIDCLVAMIPGLIDAQLSNEPGGIGGCSTWNGWSTTQNERSGS